jgi:hypothetical protein
MTIIIEFGPTRNTPYAYLVLVDPCAALSMEVSLCASIGVTDGGAVSVWQIPTVPAEGSAPSDAGTATTYPTEDTPPAGWNQTVREWGGDDVRGLLLETVTSDSDPVLLLSSHALTFSFLSSP